MAKKEPLYPHKTEGKKTNKSRQVVKIVTRPNGTPMSEYVFSIDEIDETFRSYFNIGATRIIIHYDTGQTVEWSVVPG